MYFFTGQKFAMLEEKAMISSILRKYKIKSTQEREEMTVIGEIILRADSGVYVELSPRWVDIQDLESHWLVQILLIYRPFWMAVDVNQYY